MNNTLKVLRESLSFLLILIAVVFVMYRNTQSDAIGDYEKFVRTAAARFRIMTLIETASIWRRLGAAGDKRFVDQLATAVRQMEDEAMSPEEKFQTAISAGELLGKDRALSNLDRLAPTADAELTADIAAARMIYVEGPQSLSAADRERLVHRHGDFGKIALAFGVPGTEEPRKSLEFSAMRAFLSATTVAAAVFLLTVSTIVCIITAIVLLVQKKLHPAFVQHPGDDVILLDAFAAYLIVFVSFGSFVRFFQLRSLAWNWLVAILIAILLLWIRKRGGATQYAWQSMGLHRGRGWGREIAAGLMGYLAGMVVIVPGLFLTYLLARQAGTRVAHPVIGPLLSGDAWEILGLYGLACILAPVTEELMFRGVLFGHLRRRWNWFISAGIVSLIFAALHPQGWAAVPALGAIALVLAGIREWRDSLIASTAAHAFNNFVAITFALLLLRQ